MMTPRESFEDIARLLTVATDALADVPLDGPLSQALGCIIQAHTAALLQASTLKKREQTQAHFVLMAGPCPTETRQ
jgi:hypothetical protein